MYATGAGDLVSRKTVGFDHQGEPASTSCSVKTSRSNLSLGSIKSARSFSDLRQPTKIAVHDELYYASELIDRAMNGYRAYPRLQLR